jgi:hypothetical protein
VDPSESANLNNDVVKYHRDGFVVPQFQLPSSTLTKLQALTMELVDRFPERMDKTFPSPHVNYAGSRVQVRWPHTEEWMAIAVNPDILDVVEGIIGPDIILFAAALFYKRAQSGPATPWHRDGPFPIKPAASASVWISVFDSKIDNGCLRFIPGSHLSREWGRHHQSTRTDVSFPLTISEDEYDEGTAQDVELEAGQVVVFDNGIIHGGRHNLGQRPRAGYAMRYMPSTSHYDHAVSGETERDKDFAARPLFLVRGVDRCGLNDFQRNHTSF